MSNNKHIERAWQGYRRLCVPADIEPAKLLELEQAFFAGAAILFHGILGRLDPGPGETQGDLAFMADVHREVDTFGAALDGRVLQVLRRRRH